MYLKCFFFKVTAQKYQVLIKKLIENDIKVIDFN